MNSPIRYGYQVYGTPTPFVGRDEELSQLYATMRQVTTEEQFRWMSIVGPAGIGKSRLVEEFLQRIDAERRGVRVYRTRFPEQNLGTSFAPLTQIVRQRFAIDPSDNANTAQTTLLKELVHLVDGPRLNDAAHLLGALLNFSFSMDLIDPDRFNQRAFMERAYQTCMNLVQNDAVDKPVIIVVDNANALAFQRVTWLSHLLTTLADTPVLLLILSETPIPFSGLPAEAPEQEKLILPPLQDEDIIELLTQFVSDKKGIPAPLARSCTQHAQGNPRNMEDILRLLIQEAVIQPSDEGWAVNEVRLHNIPTPTTSSAIAQKRLSSLDHREIRLLEAAAILGRAFWKRGILSILHSENPQSGDAPLWEETNTKAIQESLALLTDMEVIGPVLGATLKGEDEFVFINTHERDQILRTMDPVYATHLSRLAAQWMATASPTESPNWHVLIAECLERGDRIVSAARHLIVAGDLSQRAVDHLRAIELYERAIAILDVDNAALLAQACEQLAWLKLMAGEYAEAEQLYIRCHHAGKILGSRTRCAFALTHVGKIHRTRAQYDSARSLFNRALAIYEEEEDLAGIAAVKEDIGKLHWHLGAPNAYDEALKCFKESLRLREEVGDKRTIARCLSDVANVETLRGNIHNALKHHQEALILRRKIGDQRGVAMTLNGLAGLHFERGEAEKAESLWSEALDLTVKIGDRTLYCMVQTNLGECHLLLGSLEKAASASKEAVAIARELSNLRVLSHAMKNVAEVLLQSGEIDESRAQCEEALELARTAGNRYAIALCLRTRTHLNTLHPNASQAAQAQTDIDECIQILEEIGNKVDLQKSLDLKASVMEQRGEVEKGDSLRRQALEIRTELGHTL